MTIGPELQSYQRITDHKLWQELSAVLATVTSKSFLLTAIVIAKEGRGKAKCVPSLLTLHQQALGCAHRPPLILFKGSV